MAALRRLSIKAHRYETLYVARMPEDCERLVYVFRCDKRLTYPNGEKSRIAYIGTTASGVWRLTSSAAERAGHILGERGVESFTAHILTCTPRQRVKTWHKLERAMLLQFRELFDRVPICNTHGRQMVETDEFTYFAKARVTDLIGELS
jgi:hypothetical protein